MCSFFYPLVIYMLLMFCLLCPLVLPVALYRVFMPYITKLHFRQIKIDCRALQRTLTKKQQKKNPRNAPRRFFFCCLVISRGIFRLLFKALFFFYLVFIFSLLVFFLFFNVFLVCLGALFPYSHGLPIWHFVNRSGV